MPESEKIQPLIDRHDWAQISFTSWHPEGPAILHCADCDVYIISADWPREVLRDRMVAHDRKHHAADS